jgi:hypothetical protein
VLDEDSTAPHSRSQRGGLRGWLDLDGNDGIAKAIKALGRLDETADLEVADAGVRKRIYESKTNRKLLKIGGLPEAG